MRSLCAEIDEIIKRDENIGNYGRGNNENDVFREAAAAL